MMLRSLLGADCTMCSANLITPSHIQLTTAHILSFEVHLSSKYTKHKDSWILYLSRRIREDLSFCCTGFEDLVKQGVRSLGRNIWYFDVQRCGVHRLSLRHREKIAAYLNRCGLRVKPTNSISMALSGWFSKERLQLIPQTMSQLPPPSELSPASQASLIRVSSLFQLARNSQPGGGQRAYDPNSNVGTLTLMREGSHMHSQSPSDSTMNPTWSGLDLQNQAWQYPMGRHHLVEGSSTVLPYRIRVVSNNGPSHRIVYMTHEQANALRQSRGPRSVGSRSRFNVAQFRPEHSPSRQREPIRNRTVRKLAPSNFVAPLEPVQEESREAYTPEQTRMLDERSQQQRHSANGAQMRTLPDMLRSVSGHVQ